MHLIENPTMPFSHPLPGGLQPNAEITITGKPYPGHEKRFDVNFRVGPSDIALHINPRFRFLENTIVLNSYVYGLWQKEERRSNRIRMDEPFALKIVVHSGHFKIYVDNVEVGKFDHRVPVGMITHMEVAGEVTLFKVSLHGVNNTAPYGYSAPAPYPNVIHTTTTSFQPAPYPQNQPPYPQMYPSGPNMSVPQPQQYPPPPYNSSPMPNAKP
ncbi:galactoside-binding lectin domain-containing protein [Ditylenchus destructor]|nr:galactoside-binding lectin domain-containing protein [Ditylenchus destructor]